MKWIFITALIAVCAWARLADLAWHFTHVDDVDVEIDYSRRTRNGSNSFYFYVLRRGGE